MTPSNDSQPPSEKGKEKANEPARETSTEEPHLIEKPSHESQPEKPLTVADEPDEEKSAAEADREPNAKRIKTTKSTAPVGSEEWKELKRASHSQVERRRRDNITVCINDLAELVPTEKRQKEAILRSAVDFIKAMKLQHEVNVRKWTLEKLVADQTLATLQADLEKYKHRYEHLRDTVKQAGQESLLNSLSDDDEEYHDPLDS